MMRLRARAAGVLFSVFLFGVVAGVAIERHRSALPTTSSSAAEMHRAAMTELRDELDLSDEQIEQIHAILEKHRDVVQQTWEQLRPEVQNAMRDVHVEIAEMLRPDQRERFHRWLLRRRDQETLHHPVEDPER